MTKPKRRYTQKTLKILFTLSGNQCAYPGCTNPVVEPATRYSRELVNGRICHIHAVGEKGPRGKPGLTQKELNSPENLILLCPNHHAIVDGQHESYPAEELRRWKSNHEDKMRNRDSSGLGTVASDSFFRIQASTKLVDERIEEELEKLRKSRFFAAFDNIRSSQKLAIRLTEGDLSLGSVSVRSRALAWCARFLSLTEKSEEAEKCLDLAKNFEDCAEITIAEAFLSSRKDGKESALKILADLDLPKSRSASLMIVANHEGARAAIDWLKAAGIEVADLDSDGRYFLLNLLLELADWEAARGCVDELTDENIREAPALYYMMAMTCLLRAVPEEFRASVFRNPPFPARDFPLASDETSIRERWKARNYFVEAGNIAWDLNYSGAAKICEEYALWLELADPDRCGEGMRRLETMLRDPKRALGVVHLAIEFGVDLNRQKIEREIEKQTALSGQITFDAARARLALILTEKNPEDIADRIERYEDELECFSSRRSLRLLRIEMLSRAGLPERARECLSMFSQHELSKAERENIQEMISAAEKDDTVEFVRGQFEETGFLKDLRALVLDLESRGRWGDLCRYGEILFEKTSSLPDAERLVNALSRKNRTGKLVEFIEANKKLIDRSENLRRAYCWALYREGELLESKSMLETLNHDQDEESYRVSRISLSVYLGDWNELPTIIADEYSNRDKRTARELMEMAGLAVRLKLPIAKELVTAGAEKGEDDIAVLSAAYLLASENGWEDDPKAVWWLRKAASLSGDDGPIRSVSFRDMVNLNSEWNQRNHEIWRLYSSGEIPILLAAHCLNRSAVELTLFRALTNLLEVDPRRRGVIPAYSGNRSPAHIDISAAVGFDATALLTLGFLGQDLLEKALDAFKTVYIPHSTLAWLFEERERVGFHQPSRIRDVRKLRDLLATQKIEKLTPSTVPESDLCDQIGDGLAVLIAEAEKKPLHDDKVQHLVVMSSPVYRVASMMEEEADLTGHEHVLCSCGSVIDKLREKGRITEKTRRKARDYMRIHEKDWPNQPEIADGAVLYLDDLSVTHFLYLGVLEELQAAGFRPVVSPGTVSEADELISYENISGEVGSIIEIIRAVLSSRIKSGRVRLARHFITDETDDPLLRRYPIADMFSLVDDCAAVIVDDRCINQNANISSKGIQVPVFTTLDVIDELVSSDSITQEDRFEHRARLRRAGYFFVPIIQHELEHHLAASAVKEGEVVEVAELKAIRENILCIQMSGWLQFPKEHFWVDTFLTAFVLTLNGLWSAGKDLSNARVLSEWIVESVDMLGWFQSLADKNKDGMNPIEYEARGVRMLMISTRVSPEVLKDYWAWIEDRILSRIKEQRPDLYSRVLEQYKENIPKLVEMELAENPEIRNDPEALSGLADAALHLAPPMFREPLLQESDFCEKYELKTYQTASFGTPEVRFQHSGLCAAARKVLSGKSSAQVTDENGRKWELKNINGKGQLPELMLFHEDGMYPLSLGFIMLSSKRKRLRFFEEFASAFNLPEDARDRWRSVLEKRILEEREIQAFENDFINTPVDIVQSIHKISAGGTIDISFLVPFSEKYFERLVGRYDGSATVENYAAASVRNLFRELSAWRPYEGFLLSLLLSSHSALTDEIQVEHLDPGELTRAFDFLEKHGDRLSQLGAIEVGLRIVQSRPEIEAALVKLVKKIRDDDVNGKSSGFKHLQALFCLVDGELSRTHLLSSKPPFYRRLAALSQAALINRQMANSRADIDSFCQSALVIRAGESYVQSLVDMRLEPRWVPNFWTPEQIKATFLGRIMAAAVRYRQNIENSELYGLILGTGTESLQSVGVPFYYYLPGPLEGNTELAESLPPWAGIAIEEQVNSDRLSPLSFGALVNSGRNFLIGPHQTELVVRALKRADYRIANLQDRSQLIAVLDGLAAVAATARSRNLADELRILVRKYRHDAQYPVPVAEDVKICLMAAASHTNPDEWRVFVSDWMTELAFGEMKREDGELLRLQLLYLCRIVPELRVSCDKAWAALKAYNALPAELKSKGSYE